LADRNKIKKISRIFKISRCSLLKYTLKKERDGKKKIESFQKGKIRKTLPQIGNMTRANTQGQ
jgi:hypothetical protein